MASALTPLMASEFAAALKAEVVSNQLEPGYVSFKVLQDVFGVSQSEMYRMINSSNKIQKKKFKLPGMGRAEYFFKVKK